MIFWGETGEGKRILLGEPQEAALTFDSDAPADGFKARFPVEKAVEELIWVTVLEGNRTVLRGMVDEQNTRIGSDGLTLELVGRSLEGLLLDSEAPPGILSTPSLALLETRLLTPLGLNLGRGDRSGQRGELNIQKGRSCWAVLRDFCLERFGTVPYVDQTGAVQCDGSGEETLELTNIIGAEHSRLPCKKISQVWQQSYRGGYDTLYKADSLPPRRRYLAADSGKKPREVIEKGERESFRLEVTCLGAVWPLRGRKVSVTLPGIGRFENCPVESGYYRRNSTGQQTRLTLGPPEKQREERETCG